MRRNVVIGLAVGLLAGAGVFALSAPRLGLVDAKLVRAEVLRTSGLKTVTVEFKNSGRRQAWLDGDMKIQLRVANRWEDPQKLPRLNILLQTNRENVVFAVPPDAQACRFLVAYRVGSVGRSSYCQVYFFLARHGLRARFPRFCDLVLKCFESRLRHTTLEVPLPEEQPWQT